MRSNENRGARRYWPALILLLIGTLAGAWHNRAVDHGRSDFVAGAVRGVVSPPASLLSRFSHWVGNQTGWIFQGRTLAEENRRLRTRVAELENENSALQESAAAGERLRSDLQFVSHEAKRLLAAEVVARRTDPKFDTLLISRGSRDGVHPHSVVRTRSGLVGQVSEVTPTTATVVLLTDQNSSVSARVQRAKSRAVGISQGDYSTLIPLIDLNNDADIKVGDRIVTSGLGGVFPKGIPIGSVVSIKMDDGNITKTARLRPDVNFDRLEEVYVLP